MSFKYSITSKIAMPYPKSIRKTRKVLNIKFIFVSIHHQKNIVSQYNSQEYISDNVPICLPWLVGDKYLCLRKVMRRCEFNVTLHS